MEASSEAHGVWLKTLASPVSPSPPRGKLTCQIGQFGAEMVNRTLYLIGGIGARSPGQVQVSVPTHVTFTRCNCLLLTYFAQDWCGAFHI